MCGIVGIRCFGREAGVSEQVIVAMRDALSHRGPDSAGMWIAPDRRIGFGHRRLAILDLSETAAQPMANEDGTVQVVFNGEIYNHSVLRAELVEGGHRFRTDHADTEVIVHGYEQWGIDGLLERLDGDFAIAIWDAPRHKLLLARDPVGVKPLYYARCGGVFVFASEIKALLRHPRMIPEVEPAALYHYLTFMTTPAPLTMFRGIFKLPAGTWLQTDMHGDIRSHRYWDPLPDKEPGNGAASEQEIVANVRDRLSAAVAKRMIADVPVGVFLSGGVDSSTNVALMAGSSATPVRTFTVGFKDHQHLNEFEHARMVAQRYGTDHREIWIGQDDMLGYLDELIYQQDEPIADWVCVPLFFVSKLARDTGVKVVQVGEGADEQFCGYDGYLRYLELHRRYWQPGARYCPKSLRVALAYLARTLPFNHARRALQLDFIDRFGRGREMFWGGAIAFWEIAKAQLVHPAAQGMFASTGAYDMSPFPPTYRGADSSHVVASLYHDLDRRCPEADQLTRMIYAEFKLRLPELLLMRVDKITMSVGLEARVPFLDRSLVELTMGIPQSIKVKEQTPKRILKHAVRGLVPPEVINRKKMGFGAPVREWLRDSFGDVVDSVLMNSGLVRHGFLDGLFIRRLLAEHRRGAADHSVPLWTLYNLAAWYRHWIERPAH